MIRGPINFVLQLENRRVWLRATTSPESPSILVVVSREPSDRRDRSTSPPPGDLLMNAAYCL